jgi:hypothetical protein
MLNRRLAAVAVAVALSAAAAPAADDPKLPDVKTFDKLVDATLRDVHNKGADLYNASRDFAGTYRLYQGALETVRPLLGHRPEAQKVIETGLATSERETDPAKKAFVLHDAIETVRKNLKTPIGQPKPDAPPVKPDETKPDDGKKPDPKKPDDGKKPDDKKPDDGKKPDPKKANELPVAPPPKELKPR